MAKDYSNIEGLIGNVKESIRNAYVKGYKQGVNDGSLDVKMRVDGVYEKGLNDAWECARKICKMNYETRREALGVDDNHDLLGKIFNTFSPSEAIAKIKEYEEKQKQANDEIKVGDEVVDECAIKHIVVTDEPNSDGCISLLSNYYQTTQLYPIKKLRKTGRHFDQIVKVLKQLNEVSE